MYNGYKTTFDSAGFWSFDNDTVRNVATSGADKSSSYYSDNCKNSLLLLGESPTYRINGTFGSPEKMFSINFSKANRSVCVTLHYSADHTYLFVNGKKILIFKADNRRFKFSTQFCLASISNV